MNLIQVINSRKQSGGTDLRPESGILLIVDVQVGAAKYRVPAVYTCKLISMYSNLFVVNGNFIDAM